MQSYERVLACLERKPLDHVPIRFNARQEVVDKLKKHFGNNSDEILLQKLGVDFRYVTPEYKGRITWDYLPPNAPPQPETNESYSSDGIKNTFSIYHPFANMEDAKELDGYEEYLNEVIKGFDPYQMRGEIEKINSQQRYFIGFKLPGRISIRSHELCGMERLFTDMILNPEFVHRLFDIHTEYSIRRLKLVMEAVGDKIDVIQYNDDHGTQQSLMISSEMFKKYMFARYKKMFDKIHSYGKKVFMHSCGAIRPIIPYLIEAGVDILNPVQVSATGMEPKGLKKEFGDKLTFCGGIDVQKTLPFGTTDDVRKEVIERIEVLGKGGGYILDSTNLIQPDTPIENIVTMFDTGKNYSVRF